jgi:hypothetical protein
MEKRNSLTKNATKTLKETFEKIETPTIIIKNTTVSNIKVLLFLKKLL